MKYIPVEKLIAEVKFAKSVYSNPNRVIHGIADGFRQDGRAAMCDDFLTIIDSLQQEQSAKRGYKDCNGCEYNRPLKDRIGWQFRGCFGGDYKGKPIAEIELCPLKVAQQEHPEVDFEKEYKSYMKSRKDDLYGSAITVNIKDLARHFYELGLNARKK